MTWKSAILLILLVVALTACAEYEAEPIEEPPTTHPEDIRYLPEAHTPSAEEYTPNIEHFKSPAPPHEPHEPWITVVRLTPEIELVAAWFIDGDQRVVFSANTDLSEFQFFRLGLDFTPCVSDEWRPPFFVDEILLLQESVPFGETVVVPWHPSGTWPSFGIGFLAENGRRHTFSLNEDVEGDIPAMLILGFADVRHCSICADRKHPSGI